MPIIIKVGDHDLHEQLSGFKMSRFGITDTTNKDILYLQTY